jgi:hypothetical protein
MLKRTISVLGLAAGSALLAAPAAAQFGGAYPTPEQIAKADSFQPPKLDRYAAKLASQPDMTGSWMGMMPKDTGFTFSPEHSYFPPGPVFGESTFGPSAGTYVKDIPYTADYQAKYKQYVQETAEGKSRDPFPACVPYGVPRMIGDSPVPFDIIQAPEMMVWYNDYGRTERKIFLDGTGHPTKPPPTGEFGPTYSGHSIGHWEGNTLVVETVGIIPGFYDGTPAPYGDNLHMVERLRLIDTNILEDQMTLTDPGVLERPWVVTRYFERVTGGFGSPPPAPGTIPHVFINLNDRHCIPNVELDENGFEVAILPAEQEARDAAKVKAAAKSGKKKAK